MSSGRFVDLSHQIDAGMVTYAGLPGPVLSEFVSREASRGEYADGATFSIGRVDMVTNTGTYVDAPFHRFADGADVADLPLEKLAEQVPAEHAMPAGLLVTVPDPVTVMDSV